MKEVESILDFDNGAVIEKLQHELNAVMENIRDVNTDEKERVITVKVKLKPDDKRRFVNMTAEVTKSIRPVKPTKTLMQISMSDAGLIATEVTDQIDGQMSIEGEVSETKVLKFPASRAN